MPAPLETALSAIFWRLVDTARGTTLGVGDDIAWLGPFAAWWALVVDIARACSVDSPRRSP